VPQPTCAAVQYHRNRRQLIDLRVLQLPPVAREHAPPLVPQAPMLAEHAPEEAPHRALHKSLATTRPFTMPSPTSVAIKTFR
jgi:hypothetical protein